MVTKTQRMMVTTMTAVLKEQSPAPLGLNQYSSAPTSTAQPAYAPTCRRGV